MVGVVRQVHDRQDASDWLARAAQVLEEFHLIAWSRNLGLRERFGLEMAWYLQRTPQSQTCVINGAITRDLEGFCRQLERALPGSVPLERTIDGKNGIIDRLRRRPKESPIRGDVDIVKHRFYVWRDADVLLRADPELFGRLVDALTGVAAEAEFASEDRLLIHRVAFVGGPALDLYAEDPKGQFQGWITESHERALWSVVSGLKAPPMMRYAIG